MEKVEDNFLDGKKLTSETTIKGVGTIRTYGKLDIERLIKRLLKSKEFVGR